jgi:zinc transport system substrate-binding protein
MTLLRAAAVAFLLAAVACGTAGSSATAGTTVVASFYPLAFVARAVGGDTIEVTNLTPPGVEPHDLELTPGQVADIAEADLVIYLGGGFQPAVEEAVASLEVEVMDALATQQRLRDAPSPEDEEESDPHVWLDPERTALIARAVGDRLTEIDPDNASTYRDNEARLAARLDELDADFREGLSDCDRNTIVTSHEAFGYMAAAYGLEQIGISGIDPEGEPSPQRLAEVAEFVERNGVTTIFFESLVPADIARTLADEVGVETSRLDPLEGPPEEGDYFTGMSANLKQLRAGLGCR